MLAKVLFLFDLTKKKKKKKDSGGDEVIGVVPPDLRSAPSKVFFFFFFQLVLKGLFTQKMQSLVSWLKKKMEPAYPGPSDVSEG